MPARWIVAADQSRARIFEVPPEGDKLNEVEDLVNPEGRAKGTDLRTDGKGRYFGKGERNQGHTAEPREDAIDHEVDLFAKRLGAYLERARNDHRYSSLYLVAAPKFLGVMRQNFGKETLKLVADELPKDVSWFNTRDIDAYLKSNHLGA